MSRRQVADVEWNGQDGEDGEGARLLDLLLGCRLLVCPDLQKILEPGARMEQVVLSHPEYRLQLVIVVGQQLGATLGRFHHEGVDVLRRGETLTPEGQLRRNLELRESCFEHGGDGLGVVQVDLVLLTRFGHGLLLYVGVVVADAFAEALELLRPLVGQAELEGLLRRVVVHLLEARVGPQDVQNRLVRFPHKPEGIVHFTRLLVAVRLLHTAEQHRLGRLLALQISHVGDLDVVCSLLGVVEALLGIVAKPTDDRLERGNIGLLTQTSVLDEALLGVLETLLLNTEVDVLEEHTLERRVPSLRLESVVADDRVECLEGGLPLTHGLQLLSPLQSILWLEKHRHAGKIPWNRSLDSLIFGCC
mmetsp:Transcript_48777/g.122150  ORF Transcript_48777/g.122150 Transcript_48777/m.122150 type:complete len:362 (-) Transcript_48777:260-1345(-)